MKINSETIALRNRVLDVLRSRPVQLICFSLDGFRVDRSGFALIELLLHRNELAWQPVFPGAKSSLSIKLGEMPKDVAAQYDPTNDAFLFPTASYGLNIYERMTILHECVHAVRDSKGYKVRTLEMRRATTAVTDEAAAYLAGALFYIFESSLTQQSILTTEQWTKVDPLFGVAHRVALKVATTKAYLCHEISSEDAAALRNAVLQTGVYKHLKTNPGFSYNNNGVPPWIAGNPFGPIWPKLTP